MKVLITGGCGFIGANLIRYLAGRGVSIRILDNLSEGKQQYLNDTGFSPFPELVTGDITEKDTVDKALDRVSAVIHLAAISRVITAAEETEAVWDINVKGTLNLLEGCRRKGITRFIFASSNAVLGEPRLPINESITPKPISLYGASKLAGEALCSAYYHQHGIKSIALRFANVYGPFSEHNESVTTNFIKRMLTDKTLIIYGDGSQSRDFIHVNDICQAIYRSLTKFDSGFSADKSVAGEIFQIATGSEITINQLAGEIAGLSGKRLVVRHQPSRTGDIQHNPVDITKARTVLGFKPEIKYRDGLRDLWQHHRRLMDINN